MGQKIQCDTLLFFATKTEEEQFIAAAQKLHVHFEKLKDYYLCENLGNQTVIAVKTKMGAFGSQGSASKAIQYRKKTTATGIIQMGTAFGTQPSKQKIGDILVAKSIIPYDYRTIKTCKKYFFCEDYIVDYSNLSRRKTKPSLFNLFKKANEALKIKEYDVHFGSILSGSARIHSAKFREELVASIPPSGEDIVGGEMEAIGLLSVCKKPFGIIVVKGISDFADKERDKIIERTRIKASYNSADFVLKVLNYA